MGEQEDTFGREGWREGSIVVLCESVQSIKLALSCCSSSARGVGSVECGDLGFDAGDVTFGAFWSLDPRDIHRGNIA